MEHYTYVLRMQPEAVDLAKGLLPEGRHSRLTNIIDLLKQHKLMPEETTYISVYTKVNRSRYKTDLYTIYRYAIS